jgi:hypothetical protein
MIAASEPIHKTGLVGQLSLMAVIGLMPLSAFLVFYVISANLTVTGFDIFSELFTLSLAISAISDFGLRAELYARISKATDPRDRAALVQAGWKKKLKYSAIALVVCVAFLRDAPVAHYLIVLSGIVFFPGDVFLHALRGMRKSLLELVLFLLDRAVVLFTLYVFNVDDLIVIGALLLFVPFIRMVLGGLIVHRLMRGVDLSQVKEIRFDGFSGIEVASQLIYLRWIILALPFLGMQDYSGELLVSVSVAQATFVMAMFLANRRVVFGGLGSRLLDVTLIILVCSGYAILCYWLDILSFFNLHEPLMYGLIALTPLFCLIQYIRYVLEAGSRAKISLEGLVIGFPFGVLFLIYFPMEDYVSQNTEVIKLIIALALGELVSIGYMLWRSTLSK